MNTDDVHISFEEAWAGKEEAGDDDDDSDKQQQQQEQATTSNKEAADTSSSEMRSRLIRYFALGFALAAIIGIVIGISVNSQTTTKDDKSPTTTFAPNNNLPGTAAATAEPTLAPPTPPTTFSPTNNLPGTATTEPTTATVEPTTLPTTFSPTKTATTEPTSPPTTTPPPTAAAVQLLPVQTIFDIRINSDDESGGRSYNISDYLEAAMDILVPQVVAETFVFPPSTRLRRKLLVVTLMEGTTIELISPIVCPDGEVPAATGSFVCRRITALNTLKLVVDHEDEDAQNVVEQKYNDNMNAAIKQGRLQEAIKEVAPDSSIAVLNDDIPVDPITPVPTTTPTTTTLAPTTPTPVPTTPTPTTTTLAPTPTPTTYEFFLSTLLAERSPWSVHALDVPGSAQSQAFDWLLTDEVTTAGMEEPDENRILQRYALATLFYAMDDEGFMDETWLQSTDECTWRGVKACSSSEGILQNLTIDQDNMKALPPEIGLLTGLVEFDSFADVYARDVPSRITFLPTTIGLLTAMRSFDIGYYMDGLAEEKGATCGTIPSEIGQLISLEILRIGGAFTGTIPGQIEYLTDLTELDLNSQLTGRIPLGIDELTKLTSLDLGGNSLSGSIPSQLASLANLSYLRLRGNPLGGPLISELGLLTKLSYLNLKRCELAGPIPTQLEALTFLGTLDLSENALTSTIPTQIGKLTNVYELNLASNQLQGAIPLEIGSMGQRLHKLWLEDNRLNSTLPTELGLLTNLVRLWAGNNELRGKIPIKIGSLPWLEFVHLAHNQLTGTIPSELQYLTELRYLVLNDNLINGTIPSDLDKLTRLDRLFLHNLDLVGTVPDSVCALPELRGGFYFTVDCSAVTCPCCHVCQSRDLTGISQYKWEDGARDNKISFHSIYHHGTLDPGVTAQNGELRVFDDRGVVLGPISELDEATEVLFRFENVNITDTRDYYHVLLGGGYEKWWVGIDYDGGDNVRTKLRFNIGGFGNRRCTFQYDLGPEAIKFFDSIEYFFEASQPSSNQRLAIRYNDGEWARGRCDKYSIWPISDESVKINDGIRSDWDPMNATLGQITISANHPLW